MKIGVIFPQTEIGQDPAKIREFAQAAEQLGYDHLGAYDHVLGANPASRPEWRGVYTYESAFHEPFVLYGYLSAVTDRLGLVTDIIILPQRQTALVAKQAAAVDLLSGGRLRLGVGIGWNYVEYEALGQDFTTRGRRVEEQVRLLRALWTQELVTFDGRWHEVADAGINPLPVPTPHSRVDGGRGGTGAAAHCPRGRRLVPADAARRGGEEGVGAAEGIHQGGRARPIGGGDRAQRRCAERRPGAMGGVGQGLGGGWALRTCSSIPWAPASPAWSQHVEAIRRFKEAVG